MGDCGAGASGPGDWGGGGGGRLYPIPPRLPVCYSGHRLRMVGVVMEAVFVEGNVVMETVNWIGILL